MKRFFSALISIILIFSAIPSMATERSINITKLVTNNLTGDVTISGKLEGYGYSYWGGEILVTITVVKKGATPEEAQEDNEKLFHVAEIGISEDTGEFTYTFTHKMKQAVDECDVWVNSLGFKKAKKSYSIFSQGGQGDLLVNANVAVVGSPLYYIEGTAHEAKKPPYEDDGEIFIPIEMAAELVGANYNEEENNFKVDQTTFEEEYISTEELKSAGVTLYEYMQTGLLYFGAQITENEADSLLPMFGIHVSAEGSDYASGTVADPVASINRALEIYHTTIENKYIFVHEGVYEEVISIDSSYSDLNIVGLGEVRISTPSMKIDSSQFKRVEDEEALAELDERVSSSVLWAPAPGCNEEMPSFAGTNNSTDGKIESYYRVFQNDDEVGLARYPNGGGFTKARALVPDDGDYSHESVYYDDVAKLEKWGKTKTIRAMTFRSAGYTVSDKTILSTDLENKIIRFSNKSGVKQYQSIGKRFFIYDTLCELDAPGEWYIDRDKEIIYYYPREDFNGIEIVADISDLITINGASNIRLENFEISRTRKNGITVKNADRVNILNCDVKDIGRYGIRTTACTNSVVDGCDFHNIENGGIYLNYSNTTDRDLIPQNNIVRNCRVYNIGLKNIIASAIYIGGTGNTLSHNTIFDIPHMGVFFYGNDNIIEFNEFYNCLKYCDDAGIIYGNPGMTGFGNVLRYNHIHHFESQEPTAGELYMIYLDADTSGTLMQGNLIDLTNQPKDASFGLAGGGRNNVLKENVFLGSAAPAAGKTYGASCFYMSNRYNAYSNQYLHASIVSAMGVYNFVNKLTEEQKELWFSKYPGIEDEYGYYVDYAQRKETYNKEMEEYEQGLRPNPPGKLLSGTLGVARECYVIDNIIGNTDYYINTGDDYDENLQRTFGRYSDGKGERYVVEECTGNQFLKVYDASGHIANTAGSVKGTSLSGKELNIIYPQNNSLVQGGTMRLFWDKDVSAGRYTIKIYDVDTNILIHQGSTIENFIDVSLPDGRYRFELSAQNHDGGVILTDVTEFECSESDVSIITEIDLFENNAKAKVGETGTLKVFATNSDDERRNVAGDAKLKLTSSNEEVLSIDSSANYTAKAKGMAVVTAEYRGVSKKMAFFVTDTVYDELTAETLSTYAGAADVQTAENPVGTKQAMSLKKANEQQISAYAPVSDATSYFINAWIYDEGINVNAPKFGMWLDTGVKVRFGAENAARTTYKLLLNSAGTVGSRIVDTEINRTNGWHQIFAEFSYDANETAVSGSTQIKGITTISFYVDGVLAAKIKSKTKLYPNYLETGKNVKFLDRYVAKYYEPPRFISEEQKLEAIGKIQDALPSDAGTVFDEQREFLEFDYTAFDSLTRKDIVYGMLSAASDFTDSAAYEIFFNDCVTLVKALEENDLATIKANKTKWQIDSFSVYEDYTSFSAEERKAVNDKILETGFKTVAGFSTLFKTNMSETLLRKTLSQIKTAEEQNNADYTALYRLLSGKPDVYGINFTEYQTLSEAKKLKAMTLLCKALYDQEVLLAEIIQQELNAAIVIVKNEREIVGIDLSGNRTMFSKVGFKTSTEELKPDYMRGKIKVTVFYDNNTQAEITGDPSITYTSSDSDLVEVYSDGTYRINGNGTSIITVKCGNIEKSMVFYATEKAPYRRNLIATATGQIIVADDPVYGAGKAMKLDPTKYDYHQISEIVANPVNSYTAGVWVYDHGVGKNTPYFGIGTSTTAKIQYGTTASSSNYTLTKSSSLTGSITNAKSIPRTVGWHQIFANVSYNNSQTTAEFYFDGQYVGKVVLSAAIPPKYLYTGKNQEFKERYIAKYYAQNEIEQLPDLESQYTYTTVDNKTKLTVTLRSNDHINEKEANIIFVCKNSLGVVTGIKIYPVKVDPFGEVTESMEAASAATIEAFVWDSVSSMNPLLKKIDA